MKTVVRTLVNPPETAQIAPGDAESSLDKRRASLVDGQNRWDGIDGVGGRAISFYLGVEGRNLLCGRVFLYEEGATAEEA